MKKILLLLGVVVLTLTSFTSRISGAGDKLCKSYFPLEKGTELTYENYNAKDKLQGSDIMSVMDIIENSDSTIIKVHVLNKDKKGEETYEKDFAYICKDGIFRISLENLFDPKMMESYKDMELDIEQTSLRIPSNLSVGEELPDAKITLTISSQGMHIMEMTLNITDRKVEALESITTNAGTFECFKLTQSNNMKMMFLNETYKTTDWIIENIGPVRSEKYDKAGKLESYRILTNIKR